MNENTQLNADIREWINQPSAEINVAISELAAERQMQLTKPLGSLGQLEQIAIRLAGMQGQLKPTLEQIQISIFAGDHGVVEEGVSAFLQDVTTQMIANFLQGGAAISVLARELEANFEVVDTGTKVALPEQAGLISHRAGTSTANSTQQAAMTEVQLKQSLQAGCDAVERALESGAKLFIGGEMGIGNTTPATALYCGLLGLSAEQMTGAGTGLDQQGITRKTQVVQRILDKHQASCADNALEWLRCVGGFEIAALAGAYLHAAQRGLPVLVDGFICTSAALVAIKLNPQVKDWCFLSHASAEQGHRLAVEQMGLQPLLNLGLRLGEGSGAAVAAPLLRMACRLHNEMATFEEAAVASQS